MTSCAFDLMTWSYSRISAWHECPYRFFLRYIHCDEERPMFYASYGSMVHGILADLYRGSIGRDEAVNRFLVGFSNEIPRYGVSAEIRQNFFRQGIRLFSGDTWVPHGSRVLDVERELFFDVDGIPFTGFADLILERPDGSICIVDHKSHTLKPRSGRAKPTQTDRELDEYLRQLYLYSACVQDLYGRLPSSLAFFCYRDGVWIEERFSESAMCSALSWAAESVHAIKSASSWDPRVDPFRCRTLCGFSGSCEYLELMDYGTKGRR